MNLAKILSEKRIVFNYSQKQAAELLEVSQSTYCDWESGQVIPKIGNLVKISKLYYLELSELIDFASDSTTVNSSNAANHSKSPNSITVSSDALIKVAESLDKLIILMEKLTTK